MLSATQPVTIRDIEVLQHMAPRCIEQITNYILAQEADDFTMFPPEGNEAWTEASAEAALRACMEVMTFLSEKSATFSPDDYLAAATALRRASPEIAEKFLDAAQAMNPKSERIRGKVKRQVKRREKQTAPPNATLPRNGGRSGLRAQKRQDRQQKAADEGKST